MEKQIFLDDIIDDLVAVEPLLLNYEKKYKVRTPHFYSIYKQGKLQEHWDFIDWAGLYEIKLDREKEYEKLSKDAMLQLPLIDGEALQVIQVVQDNSLTNVEKYEAFVYSIKERFPQVKISTLILKRSGKMFGEISGELLFENHIRLFVRERLDFKNAVIKGYGYEVWQGANKLYWYDSQVHPNDHTLASTYPHHKHIEPNIKHHRIPAPGLSFNHPNLPFLIKEIIEDFLPKSKE